MATLPLLFIESQISRIIYPLLKQTTRSLVKISPEVSEALSKGLAVVALESTIISHGMPYPQNLQTAKEVESIVRENGAVPATIAILNGVPCIGLNEEELERLASLGKSVQKTAGRDIAYVVATKGNGATTVSAILFFASMVGIQVFVTGGIGGVHRHANHSMDISSDLTALGRTPIAVISAGVKSILDIPKTLEYLIQAEVLISDICIQSRYTQHGLTIDMLSSLHVSFQVEINNLKVSPCGFSTRNRRLIPLQLEISQQPPQKSHHSPRAIRADRTRRREAGGARGPGAAAKEKKHEAADLTRVKLTAIEIGECRRRVRER
ncbi:hypothetical protein Bca101_043489 [Brassica carinata]